MRERWGPFAGMGVSHVGGGRRRRAGALLLSVLPLVVALVACTPLYVPLVPERIPIREVAQLGDGSTLSDDAGVLTLHVVLDRVPRAGWLALQWFAPDGTEAASDSVWVTPADVGQGRTFTLPPRVTPTAGEWRAVVSFGSDVLRQFRTTVVAAGP